jgi:hypothetical protein
MPKPFLSLVYDKIASQLGYHSSSQIGYNFLETFSEGFYCLFLMKLVYHEDECTFTDIAVLYSYRNIFHSVYYS